MNKFILYFLTLFITNISVAQKIFTISLESGTILPVPIFYKGIDADANEERNLTANIGLTALINGKWHYDRKSYLGLGIFYETNSLNIKEFVRFPIEITPGGIPITNRSYLYSNFDTKNVGFRISFGNNLSQFIKLNLGFLLSLPLNNHFGYIYVGSRDLIEKSYDYKTKNPYSIIANIEYQWYNTKKMDFTLVPEFAFNFQKDAKTYLLENQIRKIYFALRLGVNIK